MSREIPFAAHRVRRAVPLLAAIGGLALTACAARCGACPSTEGERTGPAPAPAPTPAAVPAETPFVCAIILDDGGAKPPHVTFPIPRVRRRN